jgi:hypothetical protein
MIRRLIGVLLRIWEKGLGSGSSGLRFGSMAFAGVAGNSPVASAYRLL